jgi:hypothetical protein
MEIDLSSAGRNMLKELIELRKIKTERESILRTNQYYIAQVSQMEIKISEFKALLSAKESEIAYLTNKLAESEEKTVKSPTSRNLEDQLIILQAENEHLKAQVLEAGDLSQLKIQLEYALKMKETFEEKYREAKTMLLTNRSVISAEGFNEGDYVSKETLGKVQEELESARRQLRQFQSQCSILSAENEELMKKLDRFERESVSEKDRGEVAPAKQKTLSYSITVNEPGRTLASSSSTNSSEAYKAPAKSPDSIGKSISYANIPRIGKLNNSRGAKSSTIPAQKSIAKSEVAEYCPSFMRNKKNDYKPTPTPNIKKTSVNSFADEFPDEDEL